MSTQEVSWLLLVSICTVQRYCQKFMATGDLEPPQHGNGPQQILSDFYELTLVDLSVLIAMRAIDDNWCISRLFNQLWPGLYGSVEL